MEFPKGWGANQKPVEERGGEGGWVRLFSGTTNYQLQVVSLRPTQHALSHPNELTVLEAHSQAFPPYDKLIMHGCRFRKADMKNDYGKF